MQRGGISPPQKERERVKERVKERIKERVKERIKERVEERIKERVKERVKEPGLDTEQGLSSTSKSAWRKAQTSPTKAPQMKAH